MACHTLVTVSSADLRAYVFLYGLYHGKFPFAQNDGGQPYVRSNRADGHRSRGNGVERQVFHQRYKGYVALIPQYGHPCVNGLTGVLWI